MIVARHGSARLGRDLRGAVGRLGPCRKDLLPFRLELRLAGLAIGGRDGEPPLASAAEIVADFSTASIWHRAPVLDSLKFVRPSVALARDAAGRLSIQDLIDRAAAAPPGPTPRFSVNNIEVEDGAFVFDDRLAGRRHVVSALDVGIPFLSSLPYETEIKVTPRVAGALNGTRFALAGTTVPFAERREASLDVDVDALPLPEYLAYLPVRLRFALAGGALTTRLKVVFVDGKGGERRLELRGEARIDTLAVKRGDGTLVVGAERLAVAIERL